MRLNVKSLLVFMPVFIIFFIAYSFLAAFSPHKFTSPDENINLFFIQHYAKTGTLRYYEPLNELTFGFTRPRNTSSVNNYVAPSGFTGLYIFYGTIGVILPAIIPYITPLISLIGGLFMYSISSVIFDKKTGLLSVFLLFTLPPFWYWSSITLFNNAPASVFLVGSIAFFLLAIKTGNPAYYLALGGTLGLNHFFRFTDVMYGIPFVFLIFRFRKIIRYTYLLLSILMYCIVLLPLFIINKQLFGSFLAFGYNVHTSFETSTVQTSSFIDKMTFFLLPSGFHIDNIITNLVTYIVLYIPLVFLLGTVGLTQYKQFYSQESKAYITFFLLLTVWILIYYGSGIFWGLESFTMDSSYIRYFLPIYILIIPIASHFLFSLPKKISAMLITVIITSSVLHVTLQRNGLVDMYTKRVALLAQSTEIEKHIDTSGVVVTTLSDKFLFPNRKVIFYGPIYNQVFPNKNIFQYERLFLIISNLSSNNIPVYVFNDRKDLEIDKLNTFLYKQSLKLEESKYIEHLYKTVLVRNKLL